MQVVLEYNCYGGAFYDYTLTIVLLVVDSGIEVIAYVKFEMKA